jgi:hypothetical protein
LKELEKTDKDLPGTADIEWQLCLERARHGVISIMWVACGTFHCCRH